jgi:hypothetical protein
MIDVTFKPLADVRSCSSSSSSEDDSRYCYYDRDIDGGSEESRARSSALRSSGAFHPAAAAGATGSLSSTSSPTTIIFREVSLLHVGGGGDREEQEGEERQGPGSPALVPTALPSIPARGLQRANPVREEDDDEEEEEEGEGGSPGGDEDRPGAPGRKRRRRSDGWGDEEDEEAGACRHSPRSSPLASSSGAGAGWATSVLGSLESALDRADYHEAASSRGGQLQPGTVFLQPRRYYADAEEPDEDLFCLGGSRGGGGGIVDYSRFFETDGGDDGPDPRIVLLCDPSREEPREEVCDLYGAGGVGLLASSDDEPGQSHGDMEDDYDDDFSLSSQEAVSILDQDRLFGGGSVAFEPTGSRGENNHGDRGQLEAFWAEGLLASAPAGSGGPPSASSSPPGPPAQVGLSSGAGAGPQ